MSHVRECQQCGETYVPANGPCPACSERVWNVPQMTDIVAELNMLAAASQSGPNDDGHIIARAVAEIERLRAINGARGDTIKRTERVIEQLREEIHRLHREHPHNINVNV